MPPRRWTEAEIVGRVVRDDILRDGIYQAVKLADMLSRLRDVTDGTLNGHAVTADARTLAVTPGKLGKAAARRWGACQSTRPESSIQPAVTI